MPRTPAKLFVILLYLFGLSLMAQPAARLKFSVDTVAIGRPFDAVLSLKAHGKGYWVYPDSTNTYGSFEWVGMEKTGDNAGQHNLNLKYQFRTFDIRPRQSLRLQVQWIEGKDTFQVLSNADSIRIQSRIPVYNDTLPYLRYSHFYTIETPTDYSFIILSALVALFILALLVLLLRKPFLKMRARRKIRNRWIQMYKKIQSLSEDSTPAFVYALNSIFKNWVSESGQIAYGSMTTTEMKETDDAWLLSNPEVHTLMIRLSESVDATVYAGESFTSERVALLKTDTLQVSRNILKHQLKEVRI